MCVFPIFLGIALLTLIAVSVHTYMKPESRRDPAPFAVEAFGIWSSWAVRAFIGLGPGILGCVEKIIDKRQNTEP